MNLATHFSDIIMGAMASQIPNVSIVCSIIYSGANQRKHQSCMSLAFVGGIHRTVDSPYKGPVTWKIFPFDDFIMWCTPCSSCSFPFIKLRSQAPYLQRRFTTLDSLGPSDTLWHQGFWSTLVQVMAFAWRTKPSPQPMLTYHQWDTVSFISGWCLNECPKYQSPSCVWNLHIWIPSHISLGTMS